ncbi:hypothetical protein [Salinicola rhizosphaerae]|uniref:Uncharacterized protein n=1 Tax=Salinicola rhizosphaerae TaxID=1443141 RepID=A0ABQ3DTU8_9GAMM|nr:hypothetical protein [Salinicola rhizosphaerae]GHB12905.1 hypothetical protein GCM10009038_08670 [Salinicola rhizosphaerae]
MNYKNLTILILAVALPELLMKYRFISEESYWYVTFLAVGFGLCAISNLMNMKKTRKGDSI